MRELRSILKRFKVKIKATMRVKKIKIDSLNLSSMHIESIFIYSEYFTIEMVKSKVVFKPSVWVKNFGKPLKQNIIEAKIIHGMGGLALPLKTFAVSPLCQTVEFAGLHGYNSRSKQLVATLDELKSQLQYTRVTRIDIAIDYKGEIPKSIVKALSKHRKPWKWLNTTYYKTAKELENKRKSNPYLDIKIYNKALKEKLDYPLERMEFVFKSRYFNGLLLKDLDLSFKKMEKSIKKAIGLNVKIDSL